ncbi:hypothetical protein BDN72DRAFT_848196 [Pluteus cervinus]|uniref:Uncharacterized protein n=1 Tax=Pluteus cervinus TaxID=181527 RepID=A0ACD3AB44_9AGAR|nr:hypothetical protein BDN72DRAFT_848196 [Pluteus cervinus]
MHVADSARYQIDEEGALGYAKLFPGGGHLTYLDSASTNIEGQPPYQYTNKTILEPFILTMFHQLKCLEIYHGEYRRRFDMKSKPPPSRLVTHCLNYLRQTILCRMDLTLESVRSKRAQSDREYERVCRDWTKVYEAAEKNYAAYQRLCRSTGVECN